MLKTEARQFVQSLVTIIGGACDHCGADIACKYPCVIRLGPNEDLFEWALCITLHGSYGGYFEGPEENVMLCKACGDKLCEAFPCFAKAMRR